MKFDIYYGYRLTKKEESMILERFGDRAERHIHKAGDLRSILGAYCFTRRANVPFTLESIQTEAMRRVNWEDMDAVDAIIDTMGWDNIKKTEMWVFPQED